MRLLLRIIKIIFISVYVALLLIYSIIHTIFLCLKGSSFNPTKCNVVVDVSLILIPSILLIALIIFTLLTDEKNIKYSLYSLITSIILLLIIILLVFLKYTGYLKVTAIFLPIYLKTFTLIILLSFILFLFNFLLVKIKDK